MNGEFQLGLYEKSMPESWTLREKLDCAKQCGCDYLELSIDETDKKLARLDMTEAELSDICRQCAEAGVPIRSICLSGHRKYPLGSRDAATRNRSIEILKKTVRFAARIGVRIIQLAGYDVYYEEGGEDTRAWFDTNLRRCVEIASAYGVILAFETMETPFMNSVEKSMCYVNAVHSPYLQVYPDVGNVTNAVGDVTADLETGRGHIVAAHLKETVPNVFRDLEFGQGRVDFDTCCRELLQQGVRMFVCEFWFDGKSDPYDYVRRNVHYIKEKLGRAL